MPTFTELLDLCGSAPFTPDHVVLVHPEDFLTLRSIADRPGEPFHAIDELQFRGAQVVQSHHQLRGSVTIVSPAERRLPQRLSTILDSPALSAQGFPAPPPPEPQSLWELLEDDE